MGISHSEEAYQDNTWTGFVVIEESQVDGFTVLKQVIEFDDGYMTMLQAIGHGFNFQVESNVLPTIEEGIEMIREPFHRAKNLALNITNEDVNEEIDKEEDNTLSQVLDYLIVNTGYYTYSEYAEDYDTDFNFVTNEEDSMIILTEAEPGRQDAIVNELVVSLVSDIEGDDAVTMVEDNTLNNEGITIIKKIVYDADFEEYFTIYICKLFDHVFISIGVGDDQGTSEKKSSDNFDVTVEAFKNAGYYGIATSSEMDNFIDTGIEPEVEQDEGSKENEAGDEEDKNNKDEEDEEDKDEDEEDKDEDEEDKDKDEEDERDRDDDQVDTGSDVLDLIVNEYIPFFSNLDGDAGEAVGEWASDFVESLDEDGLFVEDSIFETASGFIDLEDDQEAIDNGGFGSVGAIPGPSSAGEAAVAVIAPGILSVAISLLSGLGGGGNPLGGGGLSVDDLPQGGGQPSGGTSVPVVPGTQGTPITPAALNDEEAMKKAHAEAVKKAEEEAAKAAEEAAKKKKAAEEAKKKKRKKQPKPKQRKKPD